MKAPALDILLRDLRLPAVLSSYRPLAERAATENWGYEQYLQALAEEESEARFKRRIQRLLKRSGLPSGKNLVS
jgi:DNA replication protein DnaC